MPRSRRRRRHVLPILSIVPIALGCILASAPLAAAAPATALATPEKTAASIRRTYFGGQRVAETRAAGMAVIRGTTDPDLLLALARELSDERDDARGALLDHLDEQGHTGSAVLAWIAICDDDPRLRGAAASRLDLPAAPTVSAVIRLALQRGTRIEVDRAAELAAWTGAVELLPELVERISTTRVVRWPYSSLRGVTILPVGEFVTINTPLFVGQPVLGGPATRLGSRAGVERRRVIDDVRPKVHRSVVVLARLAHGPDAPDLGYDQAAWRRWLDESIPAGPPRP